MSDSNDDNIMGEVENPAPITPKGGGAGLLKILMWVGILIGLIIIIGVVVWVVMGWKESQGTPTTAVPSAEEYQKAMPIYSYSNILGELRLSTSDKEPASISIKIMIGFFEKEKAIPDELTKRKFQIIDMVRSYFSRKKADDLTPQHERAVKDELRGLINDMLETPGIKDVLFEKFDVMRQ